MISLKKKNQNAIIDIYGWYFIAKTMKRKWNL